MIPYPEPPNKNMDNRRLILLLVFSFSLLMLWDAWQKQGQIKPMPTASAPATPAATAAGSAAVPVPAVSPTVAGAVPPTAVPAAATVTGQPLPRAMVKTDLYEAEISAQGGDLVHLELLKHHATEDKTKNLVLFDEHFLYAAQSGLIGAGLPNHKSIWQLPAGSLELKDGENDLRLRLTATGEGGVQVVKTYVFHRGSYLIDV